MESVVSKICGAPWCNKLTASAMGRHRRQIAGVELCKRCYQYVWESAKKADCSMETLFPNDIAPPKLPLPRIETVCSREGCGKKLGEGQGQHHRTIGLAHVCKGCYQAAWEFKEEHGLSIKDAYKQLKPKGWRPENPKPVKCCMPWCETMVDPEKKASIGDNLYVCGKCRSYLKVLAKRKKYSSRVWQELGRSAIKGSIPIPGEPELCAMPWCSCCEHNCRRTPEGEAVCNADSTYLRVYAKRHGISWAEAIKTAPPPRLLHTRGRKTKK